MAEDEYEDSLFGSPPPSPQSHRDRQVLNGLALPSAAGERGKIRAQNVGTIALPGSQLDSELPINPLALSLNHGHATVVHRPPALLQKQSNKGRVTNAALATRAGLSSCVGRTASPMFSRPPTPKGSTPSAESRKSKKRTRPSVSTTASCPTSASTHPPTIEPSLPIDFPDPTAPPPVRFLRNQDNLLGQAGRVGGVKPATLPRRGETAKNPILVDGEDRLTKRKASLREGDQPLLGPTSGASDRENGAVQPPTNEEIVSVLVGQKDIFPVLEGILKIIAKTGTNGASFMNGRAKARVKPRKNTRTKATPVGETGAARAASAPASGTPTSTTLASATSGFKSLSHSPSPTPMPIPSYPASLSLTSPAFSPDFDSATFKKRKLTHVPAGASDWDVPFPFQPGEGPPAYSQSWEKERGKRLIEELVKLVRGAAGRAVARRSKEAGNVNGDKAAACRKRQSKARAEEKRVNGYYRPETMFYGLTPGAVTAAEQINPKGQIDVPPAMASSPRIPTVASPSLSSSSSFEFGFGDLFSPTPTSSTSHSSSPSGSSSLATTPTSSLSSTDQHMFDTWMSFLEAFPVSFDGCGYAAPNPDITSSNLHTSTLVDDFAAFAPNADAIEHTDFGANLNESGRGLPRQNMEAPMDSTNMDMGSDAMFDIFQAPTSPLLDPSTITSSLPTPTMDSFDFTISSRLPLLPDDHGGSTMTNSQTSVPMIDPVLLALSNSTPTMTAGPSSFVPLAMQTPTTVGTPVQTSTSDTQAASWEFSVFENEFERQEGGQEMDVDRFVGGEMGDDEGVRSSVQENRTSPKRKVDKGKGKGKHILVGNTMVEHGPATDSSPKLDGLHATRGTSTHGSATTSVSALNSNVDVSSTIFDPPSRTNPAAAARLARLARRSDIIQRGTARRKQLQEELDSVKMRLWECTIEEAVLIGIRRGVNEEKQRKV